MIKKPIKRDKKTIKIERGNITCHKVSAPDYYGSEMREKAEYCALFDKVEKCGYYALFDSEVLQAKYCEHIGKKRNYCKRGKKE